MPKLTSASAKRAGRKRTDGAGAAAAATAADRKESGSKAVAEVKRSTRGARKRRPILERKLDLLYLIFFMVHVPVMLGELLNLIVFSLLKSCLGYLLVDASSLSAVTYVSMLVVPASIPKCPCLYSLPSMLCSKKNLSFYPCISV